MNLSPQDVVVVLKFLATGSKSRTQQKADDYAEEIALKFLAAGRKSST